MDYYYEVRDEEDGNGGDMPYVDRLVTYIDDELYKDIRKEEKKEVSDPYGMWGNSLTSKDSWQYVFDNALMNSDINTDNWGNYYVTDVELFRKNRHSHLV